MTKQQYLDSLDIRIRKMIDYLLLKVEERDFHGVADAAMDIRDLEAEKLALNKDFDD